jgi:hypothetical protein
VSEFIAITLNDDESQLRRDLSRFAAGYKRIPIAISTGPKTDTQQLIVVWCSPIGVLQKAVTDLGKGWIKYVAEVPAELRRFFEWGWFCFLEEGGITELLQQVTHSIHVALLYCIGQIGDYG